MRDVGLTAQLAACDRVAGVALVPNAPLLELRGAPDQLAALVAAFPGAWQATATHRALLLADARTHDELAEEITGAAPDVAVASLSDSHACLVLAGPLARCLAGDPAVALARPAVTVCESHERYVIVVAGERADELRRALLEAGRDDGVVAVDVRAAELHRLARR